MTAEALFEPGSLTRDLSNLALTHRGFVKAVGVGSASDLGARIAGMGSSLLERAVHICEQRQASARDAAALRLQLGQFCDRMLRLNEGSEQSRVMGSLDAFPGVVMEQVLRALMLDPSRDGTILRD